MKTEELKFCLLIALALVWSLFCFLVIEPEAGLLLSFIAWVFILASVGRFLAIMLGVYQSSSGRQN